MNKSPVIGEVMCFRFIQSGNQPCPRTSFAFEGNVEWKWNCLNRNICYIKKIHLVKIHLKSTGISLLWNLPTWPLSYLSFLYTKTVSSLRRLENSFQLSSAEESSWKHRLSVKLKGGRIWHHTSPVFDFSKLASLLMIFRVQISKYSFNSESQTDLLTLPVRQNDLPFRFISPSLLARI